MDVEKPAVSHYGLENHGIRNVNFVYWNLASPLLYEEIIRRREGRLAHLGPIVVRTGEHTGRAPRDKYIVREPSSQEKIWWGDINKSMSREQFTALHRRLLAYLQSKDLFIQDCFAGADPRYRIPIRVITETAWHSLFVRNMFKHASRDELRQHVPEFTLICAPNFHSDPEIDGTRSEVFIVIDFGQKLVLVGGTQYAGEIKKSVFTIMNYLLPQQNILSMHCSANVGSRGDAAIFFGLSGTGKTTLSADPARTLIGDDEHGWCDSGIFNIEGGCYAKVIHLSPLAEPDIYQTTRRFGTILENVGFDNNTARIDLDDDSLTENTRASYPISHISNASREGLGDHPKNIIMLTCDAFGVLPPVARLTPEQAVYHFLSGYTAKVAGTEKGVTEPKATFSTCFGAPFMVLPPTVYAGLLQDRIKRHNAAVWLVNTGWSGGPYGVGARMEISYTRAIISAILGGVLDGGPTETEPFFGLAVPTSCPEVPEEVLNPRHTWSDQAAYDAQARKLAGMFAENFSSFGASVSTEVKQAGPRS
ncbi:MAG: phosphoenolpyruvate carboxykinase [Deltaproteobacteria bacterium]|nr:phosphoenolpyruvate carboxykinase [Deltaproteobacteria bacterium]